MTQDTTNQQDDAQPQELDIDQLRLQLRAQATATAYWRARARDLEDQFVEAGVRSGDISLTGGE